MSQREKLWEIIIATRLTGSLRSPSALRRLPPTMRTYSQASDHGVLDSLGGALYELSEFSDKTRSNSYRASECFVALTLRSPCSNGINCFNCNRFGLIRFTFLNRTLSKPFFATSFPGLSLERGCVFCWNTVTPENTPYARESRDRLTFLAHTSCKSYLSDISCQIGEKDVESNVIQFS